MINYSHQQISYSNFPSNAVSCLSFTREGGVSPAPFTSLNVSFGVNDNGSSVKENRRLILESLGLQTLISSRQVHGIKVKSIFEPCSKNKEFEGYDTLITNIPGIALMIQQADCQAVMLFDPVRKVVANVHSGWRGSALNIIGKTVVQMARDFGTNPCDISAAISPSLGPCCAEFINFKKELPEKFHSYQIKPNHFDFWEISKSQLVESGVKAENIYNPRICTVCDHRFFSYRREGVTGRFASVIGLKQ